MSTKKGRRRAWLVTSSALGPVFWRVLVTRQTRLFSWVTTLAKVKLPDRGWLPSGARACVPTDALVELHEAPKGMRSGRVLVRR